LQKIGLDVPHEAVGLDGVVDWSFASRSDETGIPVSLKYRDSFDPILHQVRDPLKVMRSVFTLSKQTWTFICRNSRTEEFADPIRRAAEYWYYWNLQAQQKAQWTYRIEALPEVWPEFCSRIDIPNDASVLQEIPTDINARSRPADKLYERYRAITWKHVHEHAPEMLPKIIELATEYGYDM